jgi:4-hydroxy 2-oxovalerate aldolase
LYIEYVGTKVDDSQGLETLKNAFTGKKTLILAPGHTISAYAQDIESFINEEEPIVVSINFVYDKVGTDKYVFFSGNPRRYKRISDSLANEKTIISSNLTPVHGNEIVVNYNSLIDRGYKYFDNSAVILLNLLRNIGVESIYIAGLDGFEKGALENYYSSGYVTYSNDRDNEQFNSDMREMLRNFSKTLQKKQSVMFITPSQFESMFN